MNAIYREQVYVTDYQEKSLTGPPISVAASRDGRSDVIDMWYEHRRDARPDPYALWIFGTGHPLPWADEGKRILWRFLGTVVTTSGLVWHVYVGPLKSEVTW